MTDRKLWTSLGLAGFVSLLSSCSVSLNAAKKAEISTFRIAPVQGNKVAYTLPSVDGQVFVINQPVPGGFAAGAAAGAIGQLALEFDRAQFEKKHGANLAAIGSNIPKDIPARADAKLRKRLASTGRVSANGPGVMQIEIEKVGLLTSPLNFANSESMRVNPYIVAKVSIDSANGEKVVEERILGLGETAGHQWATGARQLLNNSKRKSLPMLHPHTGKTTSYYASNPAQLRRDFDSALYALDEDLNVFVKELYGTP